MTDGPKFLTGAPVPAPEPEAGASPYRMAQPPTEPIPPRPPPPPDQPLPPPPEVSYVNDPLARWLGPGRMPRVMMRWPRLSGLWLLAFGGWLVRDLAHVIRYGGHYGRAQPVIAPLLTLLGAYFLVLGRPHDREGFSPGWWNLGYVLTIIAALVAVAVIFMVWL